MSVYSAVECLFFSLLLAAIADVPVRSVLQVAAMSAFFNDESTSKLMHVNSLNTHKQVQT